MRFVRWSRFTVVGMAMSVLTVLDVRAVIEIPVTPFEDPVTLPIDREGHAPAFGYVAARSGMQGLEVADLDADGRPEVVIAASSVASQDRDFWYVLGWDGADYRPRGSTFERGAICCLTVGQADADPAREIIVVAGGFGVTRNFLPVGNARIQIYDGATLALEHTIEPRLGRLWAAAAADLEGDGRFEVVFTDGLDLHIYDVATATPRSRVAGKGGLSLTLGQVDDDPALEIVTSGGGKGRVIDGATGALEWENGSSFGNQVRTADVDGDGRDEILKYNGVELHLYDGRTRQLARVLPGRLYSYLTVLDLEGDGRNEIAYFDGRIIGDPGIRIFDGVTDTEKWASERNEDERRVAGLGAGDFDGDGSPELFWCDMSGRMRILDPATHTVEWANSRTAGPFYGVDFGDVDADGRAEVLYSLSSSEWGVGEVLQSRFFIRDAGDMSLRYQSPEEQAVDLYATTTPYNFTIASTDGLARRIRHANVDGDPQAEIFVAGVNTVSASEGPVDPSDALSAEIVCYDGRTRLPQWRTTATMPHLRFGGLQVADLDSDGRPELVASGQSIDPNAPDRVVYVYDAASGALERRIRLASPPTGRDGMAFLRVADVQGDARPEIVVADRDRLWVIDAAGTMSSAHARMITSLEVVDVDGDGRAEIIVGGPTGAIEVLDAATGGVRETVGTFGSAIHGLAVKDVNGDRTADYVYARGGQLRLVRGTGAIEETLTRDIGSEFAVGFGPRPLAAALNDSLLLEDIDHDNRFEIVVNTGGRGLSVFELPFGPPRPTPTPTPTTTPTPSPTATPTPTPTPTSTPTMAPATVTVEGSSSAITVAPGATVTVVVSNGPGSRYDWVAKYGSAAAGTQYYPDYVYLSGTKTAPAVGLSSATLSFKMPAAVGTYNFRLMENNGFKVLATSAKVTVAAGGTPAPTAPTATPTLTLTPTATATPTSAPAATPVPTFTPGPTLLVNGSAAPITVAPEATVTVVVSNGPGSRYDWVAKYGSAAPSTQYYPDYLYLSGSKTPPAVGLSSATLSFKMPAAVGTYNFRMMENNGFKVVATSANVTVAAGGASTPAPTPISTATPAPTQTPTPTPTAAPTSAPTPQPTTAPRAPTVLVNGSSTPITVARGSVVTVVIENGPGFARDWVAKYDAAAPNNQYHFDYQYLNGAKTAPSAALTSATLTFTMPTTAGTYDFRLLKDNSFTSVAKSAAVTVP